jgi:non-ribosomal peptide synthetase component E (peptide arylation enzyme)
LAEFPARAALTKRWHNEGWYGDEPLHTDLDQSAKRHPAARFEFWSGGERFTMTQREFVERGTASAKGLAALGLARGDVVLAQVPNCPEGVVLFYAAMRLGLVFVPVIHIYGRAELDFIARDADARCAVMPNRYRNIDWQERAAVVGRVPTIEHIIGIGEGPLGDINWDTIERGALVDLPTSRIDPDTRSLIVYTSGTTAAPKGAQHTHNTLRAEVQSTGTVLPYDSSGAWLQAQPAGHIAGLLGLLRAALQGVERTIVLDSWDANLATRAVEEAGVQRMTGPPFYLTTFLDATDSTNIRPVTLADFMTGGERVPVDLVERGDRAGVGVYRCYGSTEHPTVTTSLPSDPLELRARTDGRPLPGSEVRIVDTAGQNLPAGEQGEVITIGPDQFVGYTDAALNSECFRADGWFRTGDVGCLDTNGILCITDRIKDVIIRGGENISSRQVEEVLLRHPAVRDVAVIALPDRLYGERACAVVMLNDGASLDLDSVRRHFDEAGVAKQKTPEWLEIVDEFPRTAVGKIKKNVLRNQISSPAAWGKARG